MIRGLFDSSGNSRFVRAERILLACICIVVVTFQLWGSFGLRLNTSPSLPVGLYRTTSDPAANLVEFCPAEPFANLAMSEVTEARGIVLTEPLRC
jgi:type IV secretory pathway protease TraF